MYQEKKFVLLTVLNPNVPHPNNNIYNRTLYWRVPPSSEILVTLIWTNTYVCEKTEYRISPLSDRDTSYPTLFRELENL